MPTVVTCNEQLSILKGTNSAQSRLHGRPISIRPRFGGRIPARRMLQANTLLQ